MSSDNTSESITLLHKKAKDLLRQGNSSEHVIEELQKEGVSLDYAQLIIANVHKDIHNRKNFWKLIFGGLFFIVGGLAINYYSYQIAANSGSSLFYVFWGIEVVGIVTIARAFIIFKN